MNLTEINDKIQTLECSMKNHTWMINDKQDKLSNLKAEIATLNDELDTMELELKELNDQKKGLLKDEIVVGDKVYVYKSSYMKSYGHDIHFLCESLTALGYTEYQKLHISIYNFNPRQLPECIWATVCYIRDTKCLIRADVQLGVKYFIMDISTLSKNGPCPM